MKKLLVLIAAMVVAVAVSPAAFGGLAQDKALAPAKALCMTHGEAFFDHAWRDSRPNSGYHCRLNWNPVGDTESFAEDWIEDALGDPRVLASQRLCVRVGGDFGFWDISFDNRVHIIDAGYTCSYPWVGD